MTKHILVAYATGAGTTTEVAAAIAKELEGDETRPDSGQDNAGSQDGVPVDVRNVSDVEDIRGYSAVVLGSSIRLGRWLPEAVAFLEDFADELTSKPVALFTTCLTMVNDTADSRRTALAYMEPLLRLAPDILPVGIGLFAGALAPEMRMVIPGEHGPHGDYRNWPAIRAWARSIRPRMVNAEIRAQSDYDLQDAILSYTDLSHADLHNVDLQGAELTHSALHHADLSDATLDQANLADTDLRRANLEDSRLYWSNLRDSDMRGAVLVGANLMGADMTGADLSGADLHEAIMNGASIRAATLHRVNLSDCDLIWADLSQAVLTEADLTGARLGWANLSEADLTGADLSGAHYNAYTRWPEEFDPEAAGCIKANELF